MQDVTHDAVAYEHPVADGDRWARPKQASVVETCLRRHEYR